MRRIAVINQKGGVGKTTTAVNLAAALAELDRRVCVIDLDPQAHATTHLGIEPDGKSPSMYDVLIYSQPLAEVRGSAPSLQAAFLELVGANGRAAAGDSLDWLGGGAGTGGGWDTSRMPVLDPNPQNGQKKLLLVFGAFFAIFVIIGIIATIASP